jgi:hypothetical protein
MSCDSLGIKPGFKQDRSEISCIDRRIFLQSSGLPTMPNPDAFGAQLASAAFLLHLQKRVAMPCAI